MKRSGKDVPTGIFILAAIAFLQGFNYVLLAIIAIFHSPMTAIVRLIVGALLILCGSGLIKHQFQGWLLANIGSAIYLLQALARIALGGNTPEVLTAGIIDVIIAGALLIYLNRPTIKTIFEK